MNKQPNFFKLKLTDQCLCGSGKFYKKCCYGNLPNKNIGNSYFKEIKSSNFGKAVKSAKADICQYTIWHKRHTEPLLIKGIELPQFKDKDLLFIDIEALSSSVDNLYWILKKLDRLNDWDQILERLKDNIKHSKWVKRIQYFKAIHFLIEGRSDGEVEVALGDIDPFNETHLDTLQLFIEIKANDFEFKDRNRMFRRVLELSDNKGDILQYSGAMALDYYFIDDKKEAVNIIKKALSQIGENETLDERGQFYFGLSYQLLGMSGEKQQQSFNKAIEILHTQIESGGLSKEGKARNLDVIGECYEYLSNWLKAEENFEKAFQLNPSKLLQIKISEIIFHQKKYKDALTLLRRLKFNELNLVEQKDYSFAFARIAIALKEKEIISEAIEILETIIFEEIYFREIKGKLLVSLHKVFSNELLLKTDMPSNEEISKKSLFSKFIIAKPEFMGFGVNINEIVDYLSEKLKKK